MRNDTPGAAALWQQLRGKNGFECSKFRWLKESTELGAGPDGCDVGRGLMMAVGQGEVVVSLDRGRLDVCGT